MNYLIHCHELLMKDVAPGRNRGVYLLGRLAAVHDGYFPYWNSAILCTQNYGIHL
jgi:hypothetical protein